MGLLKGKIGKATETGYDKVAERKQQQRREQPQNTSRHKVWVEQIEQQ